MWLTFLAVGLLAAAVLWALSRRTWRRMTKGIALATLLALLLAVLLVSYQAGIRVVTMGADEEHWYGEPLVAGIVIFGVMVAGMAARYFTLAIEQRREEIRRLGNESAGKPRLVFDAWEFSYPLLISVITFGAVLAQLESTTLTFANILIAFQTGFFWQTVLRNRDAQVRPVI